jgi:hypothetical protein
MLNVLLGLQNSNQPKNLYEKIAYLINLFKSILLSRGKLPLTRTSASRRKILRQANNFLSFVHIIRGAFDYLHLHVVFPTAQLS